MEGSGGGLRSGQGCGVGFALEGMRGLHRDGYLSFSGQQIWNSGSLGNHQSPLESASLV